VYQSAWNSLGWKGPCKEVQLYFHRYSYIIINRVNAYRSFLYLLASKKFYDNSKDMKMSEGVRDEMEANLTNNLFYLAQAYGNIGNADLSSLYCHMTLQRQLNAGLNVSSGLEWCKNCMGMGDFHIALLVSLNCPCIVQSGVEQFLCLYRQNFNRAAHCLSATSVVLADLFGSDDSSEAAQTASLSDDDKEKLVEIKVITW
jgi:hypothetical protein